MRLTRAWIVALLVSILLLGAAPPASAAIRGAAWILVDADSGVVLASANPDRALPPASLTKMVTAQVVYERARMSDVIEISEKAATAEADRIRWPQGMRFTVEEILHGLLMESSNGAAIALAEHVAGSQAKFAGLMNEKARALGATSSNFVNPHGLDAPGQVASPRDLAAIARGLLKVPTLAEIVRTHSYKLTWQGGLTTFHNSTRFLSAYQGAIGVKPGYTTNAGNCLAAAAVRGGKTLVAVVMNSVAVTEDASALMDMGFDKLHVVTDVTTAPVEEQVLQEAPIEPATETAAPEPQVATDEKILAHVTPDNRMPSPAGTLLVLGVTGLVTTRRRRARTGHARRASSR